MFRFRLQRVLDLRERKERDAATALAAAEEQAAAARAEEERLLAARRELAGQTLPNGTTDGPDAPAPEWSVGALRTLQFLLGRLDERMNAATATTMSAEDVVARKQDELRAAFRDRHTLDRLRERAAESWRAAESAADRQRMDEIALARFTQRGARQPGAGRPTTDSNES